MYVSKDGITWSKSDQNVENILSNQIKIFSFKRNLYSISSMYSDSIGNSYNLNKLLIGGIWDIKNLFSFPKELNYELLNKSMVFNNKLWFFDDCFNQKGDILIDGINDCEGHISNDGINWDSFKIPSLLKNRSYLTIINTHSL